MPGTQAESGYYAVDLQGAKRPLAGSSLTPSSSFGPAPRRIMIPTATCGAVSHSTRCSTAHAGAVTVADSECQPHLATSLASLRPSTSSGWAGPRGAPVLEKKWPKVLKKST
jgi:hypothetical protein